MSDGGTSAFSLLGVIALAFAVVALAVGAVLPLPGDLSLSGLGDVVVAAPVVGQTLVWNGTVWVNQNSTVVVGPKGDVGEQGIPGINGTDGSTVHAGNFAVSIGMTSLVIPHTLGSVPSGFAVTPSYNTVYYAGADDTNIYVTLVSAPLDNQSVSWLAVK